MNTEQDLKQRILSLMRDRLMQAGFSKVTLDEIADELGISKKTLYKYFSSKDDLAIQAVRFQFLEIETCFQAVHDAPLSFTEKLHAIMMIMRERVGRITSFALQDIRKHAPQLWNEIERLRHEHIFSKLELMIRHAREEGVLRPEVDERMLVKILFASAEAIANPLVQAELSIPMQDIIYSMFRIIFGGALTDEARSTSRLFEKQEAPRHGGGE
jgi:AcrR family transcriptional regulator